MLSHQLKQFGLSVYEADLYALLLARPRSGVSFLAKELGLSRSSVYTALERLHEKGLVSIDQVNGVRRYWAEDSEALEALLKDQRQALKQRENLLGKIKEQIESIHTSSTELPNVQVYEGQAGLERMLWRSLSEIAPGSSWKVLRSGFVQDSDWLFFMGEPWQKRRSELGLHSYLLLSDCEAEQSRTKLYSKMERVALRFLPPSAELREFSLHVLGQELHLISLKDRHVMGLRIQNELLALNFEMIFDLLWESVA